MKSEATESRLVSLFDWTDIIGRIGLALLFLWSGYGLRPCSSWLRERCWFSAGERGGQRSRSLCLQLPRRSSFMRTGAFPPIRSRISRTSSRRILRSWADCCWYLHTAPAATRSTDHDRTNLRSRGDQLIRDLGVARAALV